LFVGNVRRVMDAVNSLLDFLFVAKDLYYLFFTADLGEGWLHGKC